MPLPTPNSGENRAEWIARCVNNDNVQIEFQNQDQRLAVCVSIWEREQERNMSVNEKLLEVIRERRKSQQAKSPFGYGIVPADVYVRTLLERVGSDACYKYAATRQTSFDDVLRKAANTLTYSNQDMKLEEIEYRKNGGKSIKQLDDIELPKNTLMVFRHVLTTSKKDRDGDVLRTQGAEVDLKMLLLFQHAHTLPIGKMLAIDLQNRNKLVLISAIIDMNELSHDSAVMIDNGMGRFSHGFRAIEFDEIKEDEGEVTSPGGFDVKRFEIMEESLVSVPSNIDAETEEVLLSLVEGGKLTSPIMKECGAGIRSNRSLQLGIKYKEKIGDYDREIETSNAADFETVFKTIKETEDANQPGNTEKEGTGEGEPSGTPKETDEIQTKEEHPTSVSEVKFGGMISGSWEWIEHKLREKSKRYLMMNGISVGQHDRTFLAGTFADHTVICLEKPESDVMDEFRYFKTEWKMKKKEPEFMGSPQPVEVVTSTEMIGRSSAFEGKRKDAKAGRVLSQRNLHLLEQVKADIEELGDKESNMTRGGKAICERCIRKLTTVIGATNSDESSFDPVEDAMAIVISQCTAEQKARLNKVFNAIEYIEDLNEGVKQYTDFIGER